MWGDVKVNEEGLRITCASAGFPTNKLVGTQLNVGFLYASFLSVYHGG